MNNTQFTYSCMKMSSFIRSSLEGVRFENTHFWKCDMSYIDFIKAKFRHTRSLDCSFNYSNFNEAEIEFSDFSNCSFISTHFHRASLCSQQFSNCDFLNTDFQLARIFEITLTKTNFTNAKFNRAHLQGLTIRKCLWKNTDFHESIMFRGLTTRNLDLSGLQTLFPEAANLATAIQNVTMLLKLLNNHLTNARQSQLNDDIYFWSHCAMEVLDTARKKDPATLQNAHQLEQLFETLQNMKIYLQKLESLQGYILHSLYDAEQAEKSKHHERLNTIWKQFKELNKEMDELAKAPESKLSFFASIFSFSNRSRTVNKALTTDTEVENTELLCYLNKIDSLEKATLKEKQEFATRTTVNRSHMSQLKSSQDRCKELNDKYSQVQRFRNEFKRTEELTADFFKKLRALRDAPRLN